MNQSDNLLVISHQAVIRCIAAYLKKTPIGKLPYEKIPLHTVLKVTYDGSRTGQFFMNGVASPNTFNSGGDLITPTSGNVVVGGEVDNNEGMTGTIKDFRVYDRVLSAEEILEVIGQTD